MKSLLKTLPFLATISALPAEIITVNGDTTGGPVWNRPLSFVGLSGLGTATPYSVIPFSIVGDGSYRMEVVAVGSGQDTYIHLYEGAFDPNDQFINLIALNDDGGSGLLSQINENLITGNQYNLIVTGFDNNDFGAFTLELEGLKILLGKSIDSLLAAYSLPNAALSGARISTQDVLSHLRVRRRGSSSFANQKNGFWAQGQFANYEGENNGVNTDTDLYGGTIGFDERINDNLTVGAAFNYTEGEVNFTGNQTIVDVQGKAGILYASYGKKNFYADALYSYGSQRLDISHLGGEAEDIESDLHSVSIDTGLDFERFGVNFGPVLSADYFNATVDSYTEDSGTRISEQHSESLLSELGIQANITEETRFGKATPHVRVAWAHEFLDDSETVTSSGVASKRLGSGVDDYYVANAGIIWEPSAYPVQVNLEWEGRFLPGHNDTQTISLGGRVAW